MKTLPSIILSSLILSTAVSAEFNSEKYSRQIIIKAFVDASDDITIQDGNLSINHIDWSLPDKISINSKKWKPAWKENQSGIFSEFNPPLASFKDSKVTLKLVKGRGEAYIVEEPSESNGYKLIIRLHDIGSGASDFYVRVTW